MQSEARSLPIKIRMTTNRHRAIPQRNGRNRAEPVESQPQPNGPGHRQLELGIVVHAGAQFLEEMEHERHRNKDRGESDPISERRLARPIANASSLRLPCTGIGGGGNGSILAGARIATNRLVPPAQHPNHENHQPGGDPWQAPRLARACVIEYWRAMHNCRKKTSP